MYATDVIIDEIEAEILNGKHHFRIAAVGFF